MKFSCEKLLLQNAVNTASRAVAAKSSIPALEGLLLTCGGESLTVSGYNMQTGIRTKFAAEVEESGELVVNARLIGEILRRLPDDVVTFTANDKFLIHLTCGDADFDIMGLSAADFPELPEVSKVSPVCFDVVRVGEEFQYSDAGSVVYAGTVRKSPSR